MKGTFSCSIQFYHINFSKLKTKNNTRQFKARQIKAIQGKAIQGKAIQGNTRQGNTRQIKANSRQIKRGDILPVIMFIFKTSVQFLCRSQDIRTNISHNFSF